MRVDELNRRQLSTKKPVVERSAIHFEWDDTSLLPLLSKGLPTLYPRNVSEECREAEQETICLVNQLIVEVNEHRDYSRLDVALNNEIELCDGYMHDRLVELRAILLGKAKSCKGLLIHGEGGIGKTYFLYELAQELEAHGRPYAVAFNQEGVMALRDIGVPALTKTYPDGFTLIIDACNELDNDVFELAFNFAREVLDVAGANVVLSTRSESSTSRMFELKTMMPSAVQFQGVDPYYVFATLSDCADEIIIQFQDMLFSRNPRNLQAMAAMIKKLRPGEDGRGAVTQRTALIEQTIKESLSRRRWEQTKEICGFLLDSKSIGFSGSDVVGLFGSEADSYLSDMIEHGFIESYVHNGIHYSFSSESQIRFVIARCLYDYLDALDRRNLSEDDLIREVAALAISKSSYSNEHEIAQVIVDKYVNRGPIFLSKLLKQLEDCGLELDWEKLLTQTIFPLNWDFRSFAGLHRANCNWAFQNFGGIANTPFNLTHYVNERFREDTTLVDDFFIDRWEDWELEPLIIRARNISNFVSHTNRIPLQARDEWLWFSVWCSFSSNITLRAVSQRLMLFLCDSDEAIVNEIISIWFEVQDVYARRAITRVFSHLCDNIRSGKAVKQFVTDVKNDKDVTDSIIIANVCQISVTQLSPQDFKAKDCYAELQSCNSTAEELRVFTTQANLADLVYKGFFPFDIYQLHKGFVDFRGQGYFIAAPHGAIEKWNGSLRALLKCPSEGGKCGGLVVRKDYFQDCLPIGFEMVELSQRHMMDCLVFLTKKWLEFYGGNLQQMLGEFRPSFPYRDKILTPNMKPLDLAAHELVGSLAANYYTDEIILGGGGYNSCGFCQYEEQAYNEPKTINVCTPAANPVIEKAKIKLRRRIVSPEGKNAAWFNDKEEALSEIQDLLSTVRAGGVEWKPIAFSTRCRISNGNDLECSNEFIVSIAFQTDRHISGYYEDRYLTIERETYGGNMKDYGKMTGGLCLLLDAPDTHCVSAERNAILLPPPSLVNYLNAAFEAKDARFVGTDSEDTLIACDGVPGNYYEEPVHNLILMRKDVYDSLADNNLVSFFAFSERYHGNAVYENDCDRHWEFRPDGKLIGSHLNSGRPSKLIPRSCKGCRFSYE